MYNNILSRYIAIYLKIFTSIIVFASIIGVASAGIDIFHVPPPPPAISHAVSFEATIPVDVDVMEAFFFYRINGQQSYNDIEMDEFIEGTWTATISNIPECDGIEYFFSFELQDGSTMALPEEETSQNPFILSVIPIPEAEKNADEISFSQKKNDFLLISPDENDIVYSESVLFMVSLYNIPEIDVTSIHLYVDEEDVTIDALVTPDILTYAPDNFEPGVKILTITASKNDGTEIPPLHHTISVISSKKSGSTFLYSINGKTAVSMDQVAMEEGEDETLNIYQNDLHLKAGWPWLQFKSRYKTTSEEGPFKQPKNRYSATLEVGKFLKINAGDFTPVLSPYTINGKRIRGMGTELRLGWLQFKTVHGELDRAIQGLDAADRSYEVTNVFLDSTDKIIYELDRNGFTFKNDLSSYRLALNIRDKIIFGSTFMTTINDIKSVQKELSDASFTVSLDTAFATEAQLDTGIYTFGEFNTLMNENIGYQLLDSGWGGKKPQQNLVLGTDFRFSLDEHKFLLEGYWAISLLNKDIWDGPMTLAELDTLMGDSLDGLIYGMVDTTQFPDPTGFEDLMTLNMNLVPLIPIDMNAFGDSATVNIKDAILNMPSTAYNLRFRSLYFNNIFEVQYSQVGPEFTSLANPYFPKNIREFSISDRMSFFDRRLQPSVSYKSKTNDILKTTSNPYNEKTYGVNLNIIPGMNLPSGMYGHKSNIRTNPTTNFDTLSTSIDSSSAIWDTTYSLQDLRVDFITKNNLFTINVPINRQNVSYSIGGTYNSIIGKDQLEKERLDILSSLIDTSEAAWDTTYSSSDPNIIESIDNTSTAWDTTHTRFLSQASNMQLISIVFNARYRNGLKLGLNISNFTNDLKALGKTKLNSVSITGAYPLFNNKMRLTGTLSYLAASGLSEFKNYGLLLGSSITISNGLRLKLAASTKARTTTEETEIANVALRLSMNYKF